MNNNIMLASERASGSPKGRQVKEALLFIISLPALYPIALFYCLFVVRWGRIPNYFLVIDTIAMGLIASSISSHSGDMLVLKLAFPIFIASAIAMWAFFNKRKEYSPYGVLFGYPKKFVTSVGWGGLLFSLGAVWSLAWYFAGGRIGMVIGGLVALLGVKKVGWAVKVVWGFGVADDEQCEDARAGAERSQPKRRWLRPAIAAVSVVLIGALIAVPRPQQSFDEFLNLREVYVPVQPSSLQSLQSALASKGYGQVMASDFKPAYVYSDVATADGAQKAQVAYTKKDLIPPKTMFQPMGLLQFVKAALADQSAEACVMNPGSSDEMILPDAKMAELESFLRNRGREGDDVAMSLNVAR